MALLPEAPLTGLRVLDLTRLLPGGFCTLQLAQMGADVIKIEEPGVGDQLRWFPPLVDGVSALFLALNRGKSSVTLDLKSEAGTAALLDLVRGADVLVEGFRPGVMDRLGLGFATLRGVNPGLICCSISGYGADGPLAGRAGHDINYLALSGILSITGCRDGAPALPGIQAGDLGGGAQSATVAILAALLGRARDGVGAHLDISITDGLVAWLSMHAAAHFATGEVPGPTSMPLNGAYPCYRVYATAGRGRMALGALEPKFWEAFCAALDRPDLLPLQFDSSPDAHAAMEKAFAGRSRREWEELLAGRDVCCEPVLDLEEAFAQPQAGARSWRRAAPGGVDQVRPAVEMAGMRELGPAPGLGEHTAAVLAEVGR